jgi:hypothetical protein
VTHISLTNMNGLLFLHSCWGTQHGPSQWLVRGINLGNAVHLANDQLLVDKGAEVAVTQSLRDLLLFRQYRGLLLMSIRLIISV